MTKPGAPRNTAAETEASRRWRRKNPDSARAAWQRQYVRGKRFHRVGVSAEWFRNQLVGQAGRCAICPDVLVPGKNTHVDHDHKTRLVRGLLCAHCNHMLGHARDSVDNLAMGIRYLEGAQNR